MGIVAEMAVLDDVLCAPGGDLTARPVGHLFGPNVARIAFKRGAYLRNFVYTFAELLSERLSRPLIERAMLGQSLDQPAASDGSGSGRAPDASSARPRRSASAAVTRQEIAASASWTSGDSKVEVMQRYALKDAAQAHRDLEARKTTGSTVLLP